MNAYAMVVMIVLIVTVARVLRARYEASSGRPQVTDSRETVMLRDEVRTLKERVAVLEKLATDDNTLSAKLNREIEALRDRS
ncbi:hypothetical protein [Sphingomonas sp.]|uniref:hypothetical protein n=1 Tax=Sphingomonas sp. TaxID=28214 RepID=UPI001D2CB554|nr:hypothetical protein [Sphingomonas sp.]MBX9796369.1 hypothetical protein [Sphingomonas sp.]